MADIPGLVEGAHEGLGLGHRFLRHVERCRVLIHLVDCSGDERDPVKDLDAINRELELYSPMLAKKRQIIVATKMDVTGAEERAGVLDTELARRGVKLLRISAVTHSGLDPLLDSVVEALDAAGPPEPLPGDS
jgi:GTP-binding protein